MVQKKLKSKQPKQDRLSESTISQYLKVQSLIKRQAGKVVAIILYRDHNGLVFTNIGSLDTVHEIEVTDVRVEVSYNPNKKTPDSIQRFHVRVECEGNNRDQAWIDCSLLFHADDVLRDKVTEYLSHLLVPVLKQRREREIRYMCEMMNKYPEEAGELLHQALNEGNS